MLYFHNQTCTDCLWLARAAEMLNKVISVRQVSRHEQFPLPWWTQVAAIHRLRMYDCHASTHVASVFSSVSVGTWTFWAACTQVISVKFRTQLPKPEVSAFSP